MTISSPSATFRARLTNARSVLRSTPPAAAIASATRAPAGTRTSPGMANPAGHGDDDGGAVRRGRRKSVRPPRQPPTRRRGARAAAARDHRARLLARPGTRRSPRPAAPRRALTARRPGSGRRALPAAPAVRPAARSARLGARLSRRPDASGRRPVRSVLGSGCQRRPHSLEALVGDRIEALVDHARRLEPRRPPDHAGARSVDSEGGCGRLAFESHGVEKHRLA